MILQWGTHYGTGVVYFPIAFNAVFGLITQVTSWTSKAPSVNFLNVTQYISGAGFSNAQNYAHTYNWLAFGI